MHFFSEVFRHATKSSGTGRRELAEVPDNLASNSQGRLGMAASCVICSSPFVVAARGKARFRKIRLKL
jgi:hypothetical protein